MKPPYQITSSVLALVASISEKLGQTNAIYLNRPSPQLRKQSRIRTIHSSLKIEGNTLTQEQVTAVVENKRIIGPKKDVLEVLNAISAYENLGAFKPTSSKSFLTAHKLLMTGLIEKSGKYRTTGVGIMHGKKLAHLAPPAENVAFLMKGLFEYLKNGDDLTLIKSCVFHYEMEFIHPFIDGNGRMGRLWQTIILMQENSVFEFLPFETMISETQNNYYQALAKSDSSGSSTPFIEYMLGVLDKSLNELLQFNGRTITQKDRLHHFSSLGKTKFSRADYMNVFKDISSATASRDLKKGVETSLFQKTGSMNRTMYQIVLE